MMIDDDDVGVLRTIAHARDETRIEVGTLLTETRIRTRVDMAPERERLRQVRELRAIAKLGLLGPVTNVVEVIDVFQPVEYGRGLRAREPVEAKVVVPALHVSGFEGFGQDALEKRNVFLHQLLLQVLGPGGNDHAPPSTERR